MPVNGVSNWGLVRGRGKFVERVSVIAGEVLLVPGAGSVAGVAVLGASETVIDVAMIGAGGSEAGLTGAGVSNEASCSGGEIAEIAVELAE